MERVAYAQRIIRGADQAKLIAAHLIASNPTIAAAIDAQPMQYGANVPEKYIEFRGRHHLDGARSRVCGRAIEASDSDNAATSFMAAANRLILHMLPHGAPPAVAAHG